MKKEEKERGARDRAREMAQQVKHKTEGLIQIPSSRA